MYPIIADTAQKFEYPEAVAGEAMDVASDRNMTVKRTVAMLAALTILGAAAWGCGGTQSSAAAIPHDQATVSAAGAPAAASQAPTVVAQRESSFARLVSQLSESGGFFDSDNIISNETSYLHVIDGLRRLGVHGGVYIGVGPDQNYSYIVAIRPAIAFMLDIRRDNMFEHLLFKALFSMARNRVEYLCLLFGKPIPRNVDALAARSIETVFAYLDSTETDSAFVRSTKRAIDAKIASFGVPLSAQDLEIIDRYRGQFVAEGLDVRFSSFNRNNRGGYPNFRRLVLERDRSEHQANYLVTEQSFQYVKSLHAKDLIVPVVGNAAGDKAVAAIAKYARDHSETVSAFYISNVEQYLMRDGIFAQFAENVKLLPRDARSVIIRSYFGRFGVGHPLSMPGHLSTSMLATIDSFVKDYDAGNIRSYVDLIDHGYVKP